MNMKVKVRLITKGLVSESMCEYSMQITKDSVA